MTHDLSALDDLHALVREHLRSTYTGIFPEDQIERHFQDYIELGMSAGIFQQMGQVTDLRPGLRLLDLGCGFGSFVFVCLQNGMEAFGLDVAEFDLDFARKRLAWAFPELDPAAVYLNRDAQATHLPDQSFAIVTAWNLLEHVSDFRKTLAEAYRLLKPGGLFFGIAPNYAAFHREAHYLVPWLPLLPRWLAILYLRLLGRRTDFFENQVHYVTNRGILKGLKGQGFELVVADLLKLENPDQIVSNRVRKIVVGVRQARLLFLLRWIILVDYWSPFRPTTSFVARRLP